MALCEKVAEQVKREVGKADLKVEWVPVKLDDRLRTMQEEKVDILCGADSVTLARQLLSVSRCNLLKRNWCSRPSDAPFRCAWFSLMVGHPLSPSGAATPRGLSWGKDLLDVIKELGARNGSPSASIPSSSQPRCWPLTAMKLGFVASLIARLMSSSPICRCSWRTRYKAKTRAILPSSSRRFTSEPLALSLEDGDDDFRLTVDRALSDFYGTRSSETWLSKWFGAFAPGVERFIKQTALPQ